MVMPVNSDWFKLGLVGVSVMCAKQQLATGELNSHVGLRAANIAAITYK